MSRVKLFIGLQFWLKGREYTIKQRLTDGSFQICDVVTENISCISQTDLIQLFFKDELEFENLQATTKANKKNYCGADFTQIPLDLKQEALRREQYILAVLEKNDSRRTKEFLCPIIKETSQKINDSHPPSHITLYRWLKGYKELRVLLGRIEKRVISIKGIEFEGLYYNSAELVQLRADFEKSDKKSSSSKRFRAKATIKIDPLDLSSIYVFDPTCDNFIAIPAVSYAYTQGLSLWQHKVIKNLAAIEYKKVDIVALALAKKKIQEIVEREWLLTKKGKTRSAMARWKGIGREGFNRDEPEDTITATTLTTSINHLIEDEFNNSSMAGISDIGSAFKLSESSQLNEKDTDNSPSEVELNQELHLNSTDVNLKIPKKRKHTRKQQSLSQVEQTASINDKAADEWKPDLSGWDISIGLPNSEI